MTEEWKAIPGYSGYMASTLGNVRGIYGRNIGSQTGNCPYKQVSVNIAGKRYMVLLHRLIAITFLPESEYENYTMIDHINRNKLDNRVENLKWCDKFENAVNVGNYKTSKTAIRGLCNNRGFWQCVISYRGLKYTASFPFNQKQHAINWLRDKRLELKLPE